MSSIGHLYMISAPSGTGKTSLVNELVQQVKGIKISLSYTTRAMRSTEQNGVNYQFVSREVFEAMIKEETFLEYADVFGNYYGTSRKWVKDTLQKGIDVLLEIDWQGAAQIRKLFPLTSSIFIIPPSRQTLLERLKGRNLDEEVVIKRRMDTAREEISHYEEYTYLICNQRFEEALDNIKAIVRANRLRTPIQKEVLASTLQGLLD